jgi:hypothetical protein
MIVIRISAEQRAELLQRASKLYKTQDQQVFGFKVMWLDLLTSRGLVLDRGYPRAPWDQYQDPATGDYVFTQGQQPEIPT